MTDPASSDGLLTARPTDVPRYFKVLGVWVGPRFPVPSTTRIAWGLTSLFCALTLATAVWLKPSPAGHGTHEALGLPPCGFILRSGLPCPTCGMTTSFAHAVRGRFISAFVVQPAGFAFAILTVVLMFSAGSIAITGHTYFVDWDSVSVRLMTALAAIILFGWVFKLAHGLATGALPIGKG